MKLLNVTESKVAHVTYTVELDDKSRVYCTDRINIETGKFIDSTYRDANGNEIDDAALVEKIDEFVNEALK